MPLQSIDIKVPKTKFSVHDLILKRWSARSFSKKSIDEKELNTIFEAASWAPSSMNEQPWRYVYGLKEDKTHFQKFYDCLNVGNQKWAGGAAVLILSLAHKCFEKINKENQYAWHDTGAANMLLLLQAAEMDIYGHIMAGFNKEKTMDTFNIPDKLEPVVFIALGYLDDPGKLEEPFRSRELKARTRKNLDEFVFQNEIPE